MIRTVNVRFKVLRNGADFTELYPVDTPTLRMDATSAINSSLTGKFIRNNEVDWLTDTIKPELEIDGVTYNCGIYIPATIETARSDGYSTVEIEAYDRCWLVKSTTAPNIKHFPQGANYVSTVEGLLTESGIALISSVPLAQTLRCDREDWDLGTDYLEIVNQLLDEINYKPLYFNSEGVAILEPELLSTADNVKRSYSIKNIEELVWDEANLEVDLFDAANVFVVSCKNIDLGNVMIATATNNNPLSPLSIDRRGRRIYKFLTVDNIASQAALNDYAKLVCQDNMFIGETAQIITALLPNCGVNDIVAVNHTDIDGLFRETQWEMELIPGGKMTHSLERVVGSLES